MRVKSDTAYKQLKLTYQNKETIVGQFVIKKLGNTYCIFQGFRLVFTVSSTYIATDTQASPETIQQAFDTFSIQCDREKDTAPIDFTRKFTLIKIEATGKNEAPYLSSFRLSPSELSKVRQILSRHVEHLKSDKVDIYFRKTRYSSNYYELHINVTALRTINGIDRQVSSCHVKPIEQEEFFNTTFSSLTELLAFIGIGIQYLD
ncbi:hypothetical protein [Paraburkholderia fungorum]|jgi:hypothetical protein|uniref:hypothetical protein n=1 Tax=Paraburkholderia fungorum TaxID=134537 RepID=UPI000D080E6F|nr:hypothetical protein [Paraburkholderia fungorum]PRZ45368.1 hypothetical protein BX589_13947 [Paraburkholderia fungorum]